ncbi:MAG TPA: hypothetical protein VL307_12935, partial [Chitinophagaceae bacterium]|nr:hypothetical protein [Chitinophagaceae bacterium]
MEFVIAASTDNFLEKLVLSNPNEGCSVEILPAYGAMLHAFTINTPAGPHNCIDNYAGAAAIEKELD